MATQHQNRVFKTGAMLLIGAASTFLFAGCAAHKPQSQVITAGLDGTKVEEQTTTLVKGQKLQIRLESQAGSGYVWRVAGSDWSNGVVDVEQHRTLTESGAAAEQCATGVPTADVFDLRALKPGQASIGFVYEKPFNKIEPPAKRLLVKVDVD